MNESQQILRKLAIGESVQDSAAVQDVIKDFALEADLAEGEWQLSQTLELLNPKTLESLLTDQAKLELSCLDLHWSLNSTNTFLLELCQAPNFHGFACMAERQTAGKGRRGRHWVSPFGKNVYVSLGWTLPTSIDLEGLSLAVGCAAVRAIQAVGGDLEIGLKWPNDLLIQGGKTGGILVELGSGSAEMHHLVIGVGINLQLSVADASGIDQPWSVVSGCSRNRLAAELLSGLVDCLVVFSQNGFEPFAAEWNGLDAYSGAVVDLISAGNIQTGVARGVDESGNLQLEVDGTLHKINSGEVSLRVAKA